MTSRKGKPVERRGLRELSPQAVLAENKPYGLVKEKFDEAKLRALFVEKRGRVAEKWEKSAIRLFNFYRASLEIA